MTDEHLKYRIGANIAFYRKQLALTQAGLAEKLNYSDKAVSKWERGESVPDVLTLMQLAQLFEITVNDLLAPSEELPEPPAGPVSQAPQKAPRPRADKNIILALSTTLVWFVALLAFVVLSSFDPLAPYSCLSFAYAIPVGAIVALSLLSAWHQFRWNRALISAIVWGSLLSIYATILVVFHYHFWKLFLLGIPGQLAIFLWFRMFRPIKSEEDTING